MNLGLVQSLTKQLDARVSGASRIPVYVGICRHTARFAVTRCTTISQKLKSAAITKLLRRLSFFLSMVALRALYRTDRVASASGAARFELWHPSVACRPVGIIGEFS